MVGDKETILRSIRENLAVARRGVSDTDRRTAPTLLPPLVADRGSLVQQFIAELTALGAQVCVARTVDQARNYIKEVIERLPSRRVAVSAAPILGSLSLETLLGESKCEVLSLPTSEQLDEYKRRLMASELGITGVDFGLAESGTLVLQTSQTEGRLASLLPPVHLAIVRAEHILPSVVEFVAQFKLPSAFSDVIFITGPSRTADIELTLTIGVHGPKELHVLIVE